MSDARVAFEFRGDRRKGYDLVMLSKRDGRPLSLTVGMRQEDLADVYESVELLLRRIDEAMGDEGDESGPEPVEEWKEEH